MYSCDVYAHDPSPVSLPHTSATLCSDEVKDELLSMCNRVAQVSVACELCSNVAMRSLSSYCICVCPGQLCVFYVLCLVSQEIGFGCGNSPFTCTGINKLSLVTPNFIFLVGFKSIVQVP